MILRINLKIIFLRAFLKIICEIQICILLLLNLNYILLLLFLYELQKFLILLDILNLNKFSLVNISIYFFIIINI